jgi:hypothetical protein
MSHTPPFEVFQSLLNAEQHVVAEVRDLLIARGIIQSPKASIENPNQMVMPFLADASNTPIAQ